MTNALARSEPVGLATAGNAQSTAQMLDACLRTAQALKNARGLLPDSLKTEGEIVAVLLAGHELGLPSMAALRGLQVVRGKVIISYDTMVALLKRAGYRVSWPVATKTSATLRLTAPSGETHEETWDEARAKTAGLWGKGTWAQYPDTMLKARCVSSAAKAFAGEVLSGVYIEDEVEAIQATASTGSAEVRELGGALHEVDPAPEGADPLAYAMDALARVMTEHDLREWVATHYTAISREPDSQRKRDRWKAIGKHAGGLTPPVRKDPLSRMFAEHAAKGAAAAKAAKAAEAIEGETVTPIDSLAETETGEMLLTWARDNTQWLAAIPPNSTEERAAWDAIVSHAEHIGCRHLVDTIEALVS